MGKVILNATPKLGTTRTATLAEGNYVFVGFKNHEMAIKGNDGKVTKSFTFAPVLAKLDVNNNPIGLFVIKRSDLYFLKSPRSEWEKPTNVHNHSGSFIEAMDAIVGDTDGYFTEALWMNRALPKFRNTVISVKPFYFTGTSARGTIWRGAYVYQMDITSNTNWQGHSTLTALLQAKNWSLDECVGFADMSTDHEFEYTDPNTNQTKTFRCSDCRTLPA